MTEKKDANKQFVLESGLQLVLAIGTGFKKGLKFSDQSELEIKGLNMLRDVILIDFMDRLMTDSSGKARSSEDLALLVATTQGQLVGALMRRVDHFDNTCKALLGDNWEQEFAKEELNRRTQGKD